MNNDNNNKNYKSENLSEESDSEVDEYDLYYGKNAVIENDVIINQPGPLSRRPSFSSAIPPMAVSILFIICTYPLNYGSFSDLIWASRETVFSKHEYWRIITAVFTHSNSIHLLSNLPFFIIFGTILYEYFGFLLFPALSLLTGISANIFTLWFYPEKVMLVGASGMVYGMVALWLVLYIFHDTGHTMQARIFRAAGFTLIVLFPETYNPSTSYLAHASGFAFGIIFALAVIPFAGIRNKKTSASSGGDL